MTAAFCSAPFGASLTSSPRNRRRAVPRRPRFIASDSSALTPPSSSPTPPSSAPATIPPNALPSRSLQSAHPFLAALYHAFSKRDASCLEPHLHADVRWHSALFDERSVDRVLDNLDDFLSFAVDPAIAVYRVQHNQGERQLTFAWTLSFNYPLPWRPRVSASAHTTITFASSASKVTQITDDWYTAPFTLLAQALPKLTDIFWLYPSPHAETDRGQRKVLRKTSSYIILYQAPLDEYRIRDTVQYFEHELVWAMPALPARAFEGGLRKLEQYSATSPLALRLVAGENVSADDNILYEWALPLPTTLTGSSAVLAPFPRVEAARIVHVPRRLMAVYRFGGFSTRTRVKERLQMLLDALVADGVISGNEVALQYGGPNVWVRCYDCKVGFNSMGVLSMAMYGGSRGIRRVNEIALDLTDIVAEERVCA